MYEFLVEFLGAPPYEFLKLQIQNNQMLVGLMGAVLIGSLFYWLRAVPKMIGKLLVSQFTTIVTVNNDHMFYEDLMEYFAMNNMIKDSTRRTTVSFASSCNGSEHNSFKQKTAGYELTLGPGYHIIRFRKRILLVNHTIGEQKAGRTPKTLEIRTLGRKNTIIKDLVHEASKFIFNNNSDKISVQINTAKDWNFLGRRDKRDINTVVMKQENQDLLLHDLDWFINNKNWYKQLGIPYKRGYLLYGPPGTGKTSTVLAIASYYGINIYIINLNSVMNDNHLMDLISTIPKGSILLLEDIDAVGVNIKQRGGQSPIENKSLQEDSNKKSENPIKDVGNNEDDDHGSFGGVTMSGLLNALDGIMSPESIITFMTTNHPDSIDEALIRPGRVDQKIHMDYPGIEQIEKMFERFFGNNMDESYKKEFAKLCKDNGYSPADIQEHCIQNITDYKQAINTLKPSYIKTYRKEKEDNMIERKGV